jgi:hypothetical protein
MEPRSACACRWLGDSMATVTTAVKRNSRHNVTLIGGSHTLTVGGEVRRLQRREQGITTGSVTFETTQTALNGSGFAGGQAVAIPVGTGNAAATFLCGGMDFSRFDYPVSQGYRWWQIGGYFQDDWRMGPSLTFLLSYTFSKTIGNVDSNDGPTAGAENAFFAGSFAQDYYNPRGERAVISSDIPHVVSLSYTYELPLGRGKRLLNHGGPVNTIVGGWSVSGIHQYKNGRPIHIEYDALGASKPFFAAGDGYSFRPNIIPGQPLKNPAYNRRCSGPVQQTAGRNACQFYINPEQQSREGLNPCRVRMQPRL